MTFLMTLEEVSPDITLSFRGTTFIVTDLESGCCYVVELAKLIDNLKYPSEVIHNILSGCNNSLTVFVTDEAFENIERVCEANRLLF